MTTATKERKTARKSKPDTRGATLTATELRRALQAVSAAVPARGPKPVLSNVLLAAGTLTGTDLEMRITATVNHTGPAMLLPHGRLSQIVGELGDEEVTLTPDGSSCTVQASRVKYRLPLEDVNEFPSAPSLSPKAVATLPASQFLALVNAARVAIAKDSGRYALNGLLIEMQRASDKNKPDNTLFFVSTDGHRMAVSQCNVAQDTDSVQLIVPKPTVEAVCNIAKAAKDEAVHISHCGNQVVFEVGGIVIVSTVVSGTFPRWQDSDRKPSDDSWTVLKHAFRHACTQAAICTSEESRGVLMTFSGELITLSSRSSQAGEATVECEVVEAGGNCHVKLDPQYVNEWLKVGSIDDLEPVRIDVLDDKSAVVLRAESCRCVIMPLAMD